MPHTFVQGDILLTRAGAIAVGIDAAGRLGTDPIYTTIRDRYPVFVSECQRHGRADALLPGSLWVWREGTPWIIALVVRETPQGATRLRYVEAALLKLMQQWEQEQLSSVALLRLSTDEEWPQLRNVVGHYLDLMQREIVVYDQYLPGVDAEADADNNDD
ncbi:MAG: hypothetical protein K8S97_05540 [Anaerolineae bacterium]|nr:hypothetical protein [Anaerolineae bacterium]